MQTYKEFRLQTKNQLKALALQIRLLKNQRKQHENGVVPGLASSQWDYRIIHTAYCIVLKGRTRSQIEAPNTAKNIYLERYIESKIKEFQDRVHEINNFHAPEVRGE